MQRSTKIVATLGPASTDRDILMRMITGGVDVVRMNFSHGSADDHLARAENVREVTAGLECGIGVEKFDKWEEGDVIEAYHTEQRG